MDIQGLPLTLYVQQDVSVPTLSGQYTHLVHSAQFDIRVLLQALRVQGGTIQGFPLTLYVQQDVSVPTLSGQYTHFVHSAQF